PADYVRYPAPWWWFAMAIVLLAFGLNFLHRPAAETKIVGVEGMALSDRPLSQKDQDVLRIGNKARALSLFLRNVNTPPPLTVAVLGPWGSGKSSLMNLLAADLKRARWPAVWFNAWHHQREEQLLPALLDAIKSEGVPGWFEIGGLNFR